MKDSLRLQTGKFGWTWSHHVMPSACFKGSRTSCDMMISCLFPCIFWPKKIASRDGCFLLTLVRTRAFLRDIQMRWGGWLISMVWILVKRDATTIHLWLTNVVFPYFQLRGVLRTTTIEQTWQGLLWGLVRPFTLTQVRRVNLLTLAFALYFPAFERLSSTRSLA